MVRSDCNVRAGPPYILSGPTGRQLVSMILSREWFFKRIVGVDLAGGRGKSTAVAILQLPDGATPNHRRPRLVFASARDSHKKPWRDDRLASLLDQDSRHTLLCLDAPISLPPCLRCRKRHCPGTQDCPDPEVETMRKLAPGTGRGGKPRFTPYTQRACDLALMLAGLPVAGALDGSRGPLAARVQHILRRTGRSFSVENNLLEISVPASLQIWFGDKTARACRRSPSVWSSRARVLEAYASRIEFALWREPILSHVHLFAAVTCAVAGLAWLAEARFGASARPLPRSDGDDDSRSGIPENAWSGPAVGQIWIPQGHWKQRDGQ